MKDKMFEEFPYSKRDERGKTLRKLFISIGERCNTPTLCFWKDMTTLSLFDLLYEIDGCQSNYLNWLTM